MASFGGGRAERRRRWCSCLEVIVGVSDVEEAEGSSVSKDQVGLESRASTSSFERVGRVVWKLRVRQRERCGRSVRGVILCDREVAAWVERVDVL